MGEITVGLPSQENPATRTSEAQLGLSRKEILQAGHSQASPAGPSALTPSTSRWVSGHTSLGSLGLQHLQQLWQHRWPDVRFCQPTGEEKREMRCLGTERGTGGYAVCLLLSPAGHHSWQRLAKPQNLSVPWVIISLSLPLGETASPQLFEGFGAGE